MQGGKSHISELDAFSLAEVLQVYCMYDVPDVYTLFNCQHLSLISDLRSNSVACNLVKATSVEYRVRQETLLQCYQYIVQCKQLLKLCPFHT